MICAIAFAIGQLRLASIPEFFVCPHFHELREYIFSSVGKMILIYENLQHAIKHCPARRSCNNSMKSSVPMAELDVDDAGHGRKGQRCANELDGPITWSA